MSVSSTRDGRRAAEGSGRGGRIEQMDRTILGVPARFMGPRIAYCVIVLGLAAFGLLMIYSASYPTAQAETGSGWSYLVRQLVYVLVGLAFAALIVRFRLSRPPTALLVGTWAVVLALLLLTRFAGSAAYGAQRWIDLGFVTLQPSEFVKPLIVLTGANIANAYFEERTINRQAAVILLGLGVVLPLALVVIQPDNGTTIICIATLIVMAYFAGVPGKPLLLTIGGLVLLFAIVAVATPYVRTRLAALFNPWAIEDEGGYQLIQGFFAFSSGGIFGRGLGLGHQKYGYLPMAHNDFIFSVIGEELGLVGTVGVLAAFMALTYFGFKIARHARDLQGTLVAAGCSTLLIVQFFLNVFGVMGVIPLSGKPIPFLSYGGSSAIASLMLAALVVSVSCDSELPLTVHDRARSSMTLVDHSVPSTRGAGFSLVGDNGSSSRSSRTSPKRRQLTDGPSGRRERIDLGPSAADRLRGGSGDTRRR